MLNFNLRKSLHFSLEYDEVLSFSSLHSLTRFANNHVLKNHQIPVSIYILIINIFYIFTLNPPSSLTPRSSINSQLFIKPIMFTINKSIVAAIVLFFAAQVAATPVAASLPEPVAEAQTIVTSTPVLPISCDPPTSPSTFTYGICAYPPTPLPQDTSSCDRSWHNDRLPPKQRLQDHPGMETPFYYYLRVDLSRVE